MTQRTESSDVNLAGFWAAVDACGPDLDGLAGELERRYFAQADAGLAQFLRHTGLTPEQLAQAYREARPLYESLRGRDMELARQVDVPALLAGLRQLYPDAVAADVQFCIGAFTCGGTIAPGRVLLGLEFLTAPGMEALRPAWVPPAQPDRLRVMVAHELMHVQQLTRFTGDTTDGASVLELALLEGAAEYVGALLSGEPSTPGVHAFLREHGEEVWSAFRTEMDSRDQREWFYARPTREGWPNDVGYAVGHELCRAYHNAHRGEPDVIERIIFAFLTPGEFRPA